MSVLRYMVFLCIITFCALSYAHQQCLIVEANYDIRRSENRLSHLLDRNEKLMYNVSTLESPANLEAKLIETGVDYEMPARWEVVRRSRSIPTYEFARVAEGRNAVLEAIINFLTAKAEAQAIED